MSDGRGDLDGWNVTGGAKGTSGGPLWFERNGTYLVGGAHHGGDREGNGYATNLTESKLETIRNWIDRDEAATPRPDLLYAGRVEWVDGSGGVSSSTVNTASTESVRFEATIYNAGTKAGVDVPVAFYLSGGDANGPVCTTTIDRLAAHETRSVSCTVPAATITEGTRNVSVAVDPDDEIDEHAEGVVPAGFKVTPDGSGRVSMVDTRLDPAPRNRIGEVTIEQPHTPVYVEHVAVPEFGQIGSGEQFVVRATVENRGSDPVSTTLYTDVSDVDCENPETGTIDAGDTRRVDLTCNAGSIGGSQQQVTITVATGVDSHDVGLTVNADTYFRTGLPVVVPSNSDRGGVPATARHQFGFTINNTAGDTDGTQQALFQTAAADNVDTRCSVGGYDSEYVGSDVTKLVTIDDTVEETESVGFWCKLVDPYEQVTGDAHFKNQYTLWLTRPDGEATDFQDVTVSYYLPTRFQVQHLTVDGESTPAGSARTATVGDTWTVDVTVDNRGVAGTRPVTLLRDDVVVARQNVSIDDRTVRDPAATFDYTFRPDDVGNHTFTVRSPNTSKSWTTQVAPSDATVTIDDVTAGSPEGTTRVNATVDVADGRPARQDVELVRNGTVVDAETISVDAATDTATVRLAAPVENPVGTTVDFTVRTATDAATTTATVQPRPRPDPVVGTAEPTDPDDDGLYEDVNGNGRQDIADATRLFHNKDSVEVQFFDFNDSGEMDIGDAVALFRENTA